MMTAYGTLQVAVEAMKQGAYDYIGKPFDVDEVLLVVGKALEAQVLAREVTRLRQRVEEPFDLGGIVGGSPAMQQIFKAVGKVAGTDLTVLLRGESGTGKELIARAVHENSRRKGRPFVPVNCAAIPRELLESELFGHEKGAFTGAVADYFLLRRTRLKPDDLYRRHGIYEYDNGVNWRAVGALAAGIAMALLGLVASPLRFLYDYAWFIGFGVAGAVYLVLMQRAPSLDDVPQWEGEG